MDKEFSSTTDREVYVNRTETRPADDASGTGWAVALIVLILAIGFGFVAFSNNQAASELRTSQALDTMRQESQQLTNSIPQVVPPVSAPSTNSVEVKVPEVKMPEVKAPEVNITTPAPAEESAPAADSEQ